MSSRAALIVLGLLIAFTLDEFFDVPRRIAIALGLLPFVLAEARGLVGPYEKSARDLMYDAPDRPEQK